MNWPDFLLRCIGTDAGLWMLWLITCTGLDAVYGRITSPLYKYQTPVCAVFVGVGVLLAIALVWTN